MYREREGELKRKEKMDWYVQFTFVSPAKRSSQKGIEDLTTTCFKHCIEADLIWIGTMLQHAFQQDLKWVRWNINKKFKKKNTWDLLPPVNGGSVRMGFLVVNLQKPTGPCQVASACCHPLPWQALSAALHVSSSGSNKAFWAGR